MSGEKRIRACRIESVSRRGGRGAIFSGIVTHALATGAVDPAISFPVPPRALTVTSATCSQDVEHVPPAPNCTCGIHAVKDVRELLTLAQAVEFPTPPDYAIRTAAHVITEGWLYDPIPRPEGGPHRLVELLEDGTMRDPGNPFQALSGAFSLAGIGGKPAPRQVASGVVGDPAQTYRGSRFEALRFVARRVDNRHRGVRALPGPVEFVPDRLQDVITRNIEADAMRKDWWKA